MKTLDVAIGGKTFTINGMTFDQLVALDESSADGALGPLKTVRRHIEIALSLDFPNFKFDGGVRTTLGELAAAHAEILVFAGFLQPKASAESENEQAAAAG